MPTWLNKFASAADEHRGLIYVGGEYTNFHDNDADYRRYGYPVCSASVYNVEEDKWDFLPDMNTKIADCRGVYVDGKFYVVYNQVGIFFQVFDSYTRSWKSMANRGYKMVNEFGRVCPLSAYGRLFCLSGRGLIEYDYSEDKMHFRGPGPSFMEERARINFAIDVGHNVFVSSLNLFHCFNFATEAGHNNFVRSFDPFHRQKFCKLAPPRETGGAFKWIGIERPSGLQGTAIRAATLDL